MLDARSGRSTWGDTAALGGPDGRSEPQTGRAWHLVPGAVGRGLPKRQTRLSGYAQHRSVWVQLKGRFRDAASVAPFAVS